MHDPLTIPLKPLVQTAQGGERGIFFAPYLTTLPEWSLSN